MKIECYCDGSCYNSPGKNYMGVGVYIIVHSLKPLEFARHVFAGLGTNNIAEYLAVLLAMVTACPCEPEHDLFIYSDSQLVIKQLNGEYSTKDKKLQKIQNKIKELEAAYHSVTYQWVSREDENQQKADELSKRGNPYFNEDYVATHIKKYIPDL